MTPKIRKNSSFGATVGYVMGPGDQKIEGRAELIGGNCASRDAAGITREFEQLSRSDVEKPVLHFSLNANPADGRISDEKWSEISREFLAGYGIDPDKHQFIIVRHSDKDRDHVHIVANRVSCDRELMLPPFRDYKHSHQVCREIERRHGLTPTIEGQRQASAGLVADLREKVSAAREAARGKGFSEFKARLAEQGVKVIEYRHEKTGKLNGLAFEMRGHRPVKAGALGREFTAGQLSTELSQTTPTMSPTTTTAAAGAEKAAGAMSALIKSTADQVKKQQQDQQGKRRQREDELE